ncbi:MAG: hypothetical protein SGI96_04240 [Bacteroidota bacterium]|nr:hypothetical protein [Bacteroidota bacterium]
MDERLAVNANAIEVLDKQLAARAKKNQYGFVAVGSGTDAYIHYEEQQQMVKELENDKEYYVKKAIVWIKKNFIKGK